MTVIQNGLHDPVVAELTEALGRPLRVLHIGNIANNAYNNARIQRQYGIEADVICYDYYHVMATPEWEDGNLTTKVDPNLPNWWQTNLGGFRRPSWYVQGPASLCVEYLQAVHSGDEKRRWLAESAIEQSYVDLLRQDALNKGHKWRDPRPWLSRYAGASINNYPGNKLRFKYLVYSISKIVTAVTDRIGRRIVTAPQSLRSIYSELKLQVLWPTIAAAVAKPGRVPGSGVVLSAYLLGRKIAGRDVRDQDSVLDLICVTYHDDSTLVSILSRLFVILLQGLPLVLLLPVAALLKFAARRSLKDICGDDSRLQGFFDTSLSLLESDPFPHISTESTRDHFVEYLREHALRFRPLLKKYDVIQGYSIDGIIPLVNQHPAFASYEHGTLRELPFENTLTGLMCRIAYVNSPAIFVTNTDVLPSVERLALRRERVHYLPHAFDDQKLTNWRDSHHELSPPSNEIVLFSPTRQHWQDADRSMTKGNDIMLKAAGRLWKQGRHFRLVLVEWGQDVEASKALIREFDHAEAVEWVPPMGKQDLWRAYCTCHAVLDQFVLPALGGVGFETLALGCRLISHIDEPTLKHFFGAAPPVLPAADVDDVVDSISKILDDPLDLAGIGGAGRDWIDQWHSARRTVAIQSRVYHELLGYGSRDDCSGEQGRDGVGRTQVRTHNG